MKAVIALLLASLAFSPSSFAQEKKAEKKKPVAKKVQKKAEKKAAAASSSGDWSRFQSSANRDLKADEEKRKAKAAKK